MNAVRMVHSIENLESRRLLAAGVSLHDGLLKIQGDNKIDNVVFIQIDADDATKLNVTLNDNTTAYNVADITRIRFLGGKKNDQLEINELNGVISIPASLQGNQGDDTLIGGSGNDIIKGLAGNDSIVGNAGNDKLEGGVGDDMISGGDGNDNIKADNGKDEVHGGAGDDVIKGLAGDDKLYGDEGDDSIDGGSGDDSIAGGDGADLIVARSGVDLVSGCVGADVLHLGKKAIDLDDDPTDI